MGNTNPREAVIKEKLQELYDMANRCYKSQNIDKTFTDKYLPCLFSLRQRAADYNFPSDYTFDSLSSQEQDKYLFLLGRIDFISQQVYDYHQIEILI